MVAAHCVAAAPVQAAAAAAARPPPCRSPAAARTLQARSRPWAPQPSQQRQQQQQLQQQQQRQCQQQQARRGRRPWWLAAASSSGNGASAAGTEAEDPLAGEPTPEELAEAEALLKDFLEGMGAAGTTDRPSDMGLKGALVGGARALPAVAPAACTPAALACHAHAQPAAPAACLVPGSRGCCVTCRQRHICCIACCIAMLCRRQDPVRPGGQHGWPVQLAPGWQGALPPLPRVLDSTCAGGLAWLRAASHACLGDAAACTARRRPFALPRHPSCTPSHAPRSAPSLRSWRRRCRACGARCCPRTSLAACRWRRCGCQPLCGRALRLPAERGTARRPRRPAASVHAPRSAARRRRSSDLAPDLLWTLPRSASSTWTRWTRRARSRLPMWRSRTRRRATPPTPACRWGGFVGGSAGRALGLGATDRADRAGRRRPRRALRTGACRPCPLAGRPCLLNARPHASLAPTGGEPGLLVARLPQASPRGGGPPGRPAGARCCRSSAAGCRGCGLGGGRGAGAGSPRRRPPADPSNGPPAVTSALQRVMHPRLACDLLPPAPQPTPACPLDLRRCCTA